MTLGTTTVGGAAVGSVESTVRLASLPSRTLAMSRPGVVTAEQRGGVGGTALGGGAVGSTAGETSTNALPLNAQGAVSVTPQPRTLTLSRGTLGVAVVGAATVAVPQRALTLTRAVPGVSLRVAVPSRTLALSRDGDEQDFETGGVGSVGVGGGAVGGTATESLANALPTDYFGSVDVSLPPRTLTLSREELTAVYVLSVPSRTLTLSRATPPATGIGTATATPPTRVLTLRRGAPRIGYTEWVIAGDEVTDILTETATPERLSLTARVSRPTLRDVVRPLRSDEGKYRVFADDSGGYRAVDTADGNNTFVINAPIGRVPLRPLRDEYHVDRYEEEVVETTGDEWDVTLELVPDATRDDDATVDETPTASEYAFETVNGTIATDRVDADVTGVGEGGVDRATLTLKLTFDQAYALERALAQNRGTRVRTIEDGTNRAVDETVDGSNTLMITSPDEDTLPSGEYVVVEPFESTRLNDSWQVVELEIVPTD